QRPDAQVPVRTEHVCCRSGRLGFLVNVTGSQTMPDPSEEAVRLAGLQAARVPHDVASERDIAESVSFKLGYLLVPLAVVALVIWLLVRRRRSTAPPPPPTPLVET